MPDIKGYEGRYFITSCGKVWSYKKKLFLKPEISNWGYLRVNLYDSKGKMKHESIHRLVATAYVPNPNNYPEVNHKDENKKNNAAMNLEWSTPKLNSNHGTRNRRIALSMAKPIVCIETGIEFESQQDASRKMGLHQWRISSSCINGCEVKGYHFKFKEVIDNA